MEYRVLGASGVRVSALGLGGMGFGRWANSNAGDCAAIIRAAIDAGINLIDTADVYSHGESEQFIGRAIEGRRDGVVLATKFHHSMGPDVNMQGNSRRWITRAVEDSLRRLGTDWIDLYQVHRPDPGTDIAETLEALTDLVRAGKIRMFGCSTFRPHEIIEAQWAARERQTGRLVSEQPPYSLLARGIEADLLPVCAEQKMGAITWSPLAGGWLSGHFVPEGGTDAAQIHRRRRNASRFDPAEASNQQKLAALDQFHSLAADSGIPLPHLAVAFAKNHPAVSSVLLGPRSMEQLTSLLPAADTMLTPDVLDAVDDIVSPGTTINPADAGWGANAALRLARRRR
ncbi:aldo/keto reductase [Nocardioides massiliensis]|uniref:Aryl-alcohol dehydrogenase-like predicted oxidoreductase n=1 Tax=Nocardioides massiliensis TaxID=1325935 RepID=A0ABT9NK84_9ACTN|nr:aldo/keto reductase [Nocardioides massiliensis]MDP9820819.1 aryl-alcohol dehydrogenase-like predicted oxidoreductase [Nocardioides massiliensis]